MSSSTFSSEPTASAAGGQGEGAGWRRFSLLFVAATIIAFVGLIAVIVAIDPYDTGRFALVEKQGVPHQGPRTANASRGRDKAFNAATIGNSHIQLINPGDLSEQTGLSFVSLTVPGTTYREQLVIADYFRRHHPDAAALVFGIDGEWCTETSARPLFHPFPFWLYAESDLTFLRGLVRYDIIERLEDRIYLLRGTIKRTAVRNGFWNYEPEYEWLGYGKTDGPTKALREEKLTSLQNHTEFFPAADELASFLAKLPAETAVVLLRPPAYITGLPKPGIPAAEADKACRAAFAKVAQGRPGTALLDWRVDRPENRVIENFFDHTHYRLTLARTVQNEIAETIRQLRAGGA